MRIAFITSHFPPEHWSGTDVYTYNIATGLKEAGHTVAVLYAPIWQSEEEPYAVHYQDTKYDDLTVRRLNFNWRVAKDYHGYIYDYNPAIEKVIREFLQQQKPDIVHITSAVHLSSSALLAPLQLGLPVVFTMTDYWVICPKTTLQMRDGSLCNGRKDGLSCLHCLNGETRIYGILKNIPDPFYRLLQPALTGDVLATRSGSLGLIRAVEKRNIRLENLLHRVDCLISPSRFLAKKIAETGIVSQDRIHYLAHGHNVEQAQKGQIKKETQDQIRFGFTGHLLPHKGVHLLIAAFHQLQASSYKPRLLIYGHLDESTAYGRELLALAKNKPEIEFRGRFENHQIGKVLSEIDILVVPSMWYENAPVTIAEGFAAKTPIIATDLGGMAEAVHHNVDGLLSPSGDIENLAAQMQQVLNEPELISQLRENISPVKTIQQEVSELEFLYGQLRNK